MGNFKIRKGEIDDAKEIGDLIAVLSRKFITHEFSSEAEQYFLSSNDGKAVEEFMKSGFSYFVALDSGRIAGAIGIRDDSHIHHLFVDIPYQGRGLARELWGEAMTECFDRGNAGRFTVNSSSNAIAIYEKFGFVRAGPMLEKNGVSYHPMEYCID